MRSATVVEILVTYISLGWAYVLFTNPDLFQETKNFVVLREIFEKEMILGLIVLAIALVKVIGIIINHTFIRWGGLILSALFWCFISATQFAAQDAFDLNTGFIVYSGVAVMCLWTSKEVMRNGQGTVKRGTGGAGTPSEKRPD